VKRFGLGLVAVVALISIGSMFTSSSSSPPVHEYQGTTFVDGVCFVDDAGTLWCSERA
jgi:hypothetical protein